MIRLTGLLVLLAAQGGNAWAAGEMASIICTDGDMHVVRLDETSAGDPAGHEATLIHLGPTKTVWLRLPDRASVSNSQTRPIPVPDLSARSVELLVDHPGGRTQLVTAAASPASANGATKVDLIRARIETTSFQVPPGCRVLGSHERENYAAALLNNAGCLLPRNLHASLARIPGGLDGMRTTCGWDEDVRLAIRALEKSADLGSREAGWILAQLFLGDVDPDLQDHRQALIQLSRTAGLDHASADLMTGIMRWRGKGLKTSPAAAFTTLLPHARRGSREAQGIIGMMYLTGQGVPVNRVQAYAWCHLAAANAPLQHSDPVSCRDAAETQMSFDDVLDARDLAVEIHHRRY